MVVAAGGGGRSWCGHGRGVGERNGQHLGVPTVEHVTRATTVGDDDATMDDMKSSPSRLLTSMWMCTDSMVDHARIW